jgi:DNA-binding CsgD family transcriptional regulator
MADNRFDPRKVHLSDAEKQYLELLARGYPRAAVAETVGLSEATLKNHLLILYRKLRVGNALSAVSVALSFELIPPHRVRHHIVKSWEQAA